MSDKTFDVVIVGSGPLAAVFTRMLVESGKKVCVFETGPVQSDPPGAHQKNSYRYQYDVNSFTNVIKGHLQPYSVPKTSTSFPSNLDEISVLVDGTSHLNQNPHQKPEVNLGAAAATYCVGGMGTHWTCATPRLTGKEKFSDLISDEEMSKLYEQAEALYSTDHAPFEGTMLQETVKESLINYFSIADKSVKPNHLPLAVKYDKDLKFSFWTGPSDIYGETLTQNKFVLKANYHVQKIHFQEKNNQQVVTSIDAKDLQNNIIENYKAKVFIICAGAVLTPQLLFASGIHEESKHLPALGKYLCEQTMTFCQVVMKKSIYHSMITKFKKEADSHHVKFPNDPVWIPYRTPLPQCWIPYSDSRPWHCQVHRDAFSYGGTAPSVDNRLVVDFRWFGVNQPSIENKVVFEKGFTDMFGMPQPTFIVRNAPEDVKKHHDMMTDMVNVALSIGGFLPGSEPQFMEPGLALHITGTVRMGKSKEDSCVDTHSKVHGFVNIFLGGNGVIPTGIAANPTLTSSALAIKSAQYIIQNWDALSK